MPYGSGLLATNAVLVIPGLFPGIQRADHSPVELREIVRNPAGCIIPHRRAPAANWRQGRDDRSRHRHFVLCGFS
jgi:hypothetical protein